LDQERTRRESEMSVLHQKIEGISLQRGELQQEIFKLKKDLNFHRKMSIVLLTLSLAWAAVLLIWK